jgi:hypothetical protein
MIIWNYCNILPNELDGEESNGNLQSSQKAKYKKTTLVCPFLYVLEYQRVLTVQPPRYRIMVYTIVHAMGAAPTGNWAWAYPRFLFPQTSAGRNS